MNLLASTAPTTAIKRNTAMNTLANATRLAFVAAIVLALHASAAIRTWNGSATPDDSWTTGANWVGGTAPANGDWTDQALFTENSPATKNVNIPSTRSIRSITFESSVGWTIIGSTLTLRYFESSGTGTNSVNNAKTYQGNLTWTIADNNILALNSLYQDGSGRILTFGGGGTVTLGSRIDGWGTTNSLVLNDITLDVAGNRPYLKTDVGLITYITHENTMLLLQNTVAGVQALIDEGKIVDNVGQGLALKDLGGGKVGISVAAAIPEPASLSLLALAGLFCLRRHRG